MSTSLHAVHRWTFVFIITKVNGIRLMASIFFEIWHKNGQSLTTRTQKRALVIADVFYCHCTEILFHLASY